MFIRIAIHVELIIYLFLRALPIDLPYPLNQGNLEKQIIGCHFLLNGKFSLPPDVERHFTIMGKVIFATGIFVFLMFIKDIIEVLIGK